MKNRKQPFTKSSWWRYFGSAGAIAAPLVIVIACGDKAAEPPAEPVIALNHNELTRVGVTGDSAHPMFSVPRELIFANEQNELSAEGTKQVAEVYARTLLKPPTPGSAVNSNFMPLELLQAYLRGGLTWRDDKLYFTDEAQNTVDVIARYGQLFGFDRTNYERINYLGPWPTNTVEVAYFPRPGFALPPTELGQPVKPNVSALKVFVNLDDSLAADSAGATTLRAALTYDNGSTHNNVRWTRALTWADFPSFWGEVASGFSFFTSDPGVSSAALPTAFAYEANARQLQVQLTPKSNYVLSRAIFDLTPYANLAAITTLVDADPAYIAFRERNALARYQVRALNGIIEATGDEPLPAHVKLGFATSATPSEWVDAFTFSQAVLERQGIAPGPIAVYLATIGETEAAPAYVVRSPIVALAQQPAPIAFVAATSLQTALRAQQVDMSNSTLTSIAWTNVVSDVSSYGSGINGVSYAYGQFADARAAYTANAWTPTLPTVPLVPATGDNPLRLFVRMEVAPQYLTSPLIVDLTSTSLINELVFRLTVVDVAPVAAQLDALQPTINATHTQVTWNSPGITIPEALRATVLRVEYLSGPYVSYNEALQATTWSTALPSTVSPVHAERNLWARIITPPGARISVANYRNLTSSSGVRTIRTAIDALINSNNYEPSNNVIGALDGQFTFAVNNNLPVSTKLEWQVAGRGDWIATDELLAALSTLTSLSDVAQTRSRLAVLDPSAYVLQDPREGLVRVNVLGIINLRDFFTQVASLRVDVDNSTAGNLRWLNANTALATSGPLTQALDHLEFIIGDFAGVAPASDDAQWVAELPTSFYNTLAAPEMWMRVILKAGYVGVPTRVTSLPATGLKNVTVTTTVDPAPLDMLLRRIVAAKTATHQQLVWNNANFTIPDALKSVIERVEFREGPIPPGVSVADLTGWQTALPTRTAFDPDASARGLWARYIQIPNRPQLSREYIDLTTSSGILNVPGVVDETSWYQALDLSTVAIRGNYENMVLDNDLPSTVPPGITLLFQYELNGVASELFTFANLQSYFSTNYRVLQGRVDHTSFTVQLGTIPRPPKPYVILDNKKTALNVKDFFANPAFDANSYFDQYYAASNISTSGTHDNVTMFLRAVDTVPEIAKVEYFVSDMPGQPPALAIWMPTLPTAVPFIFLKRFLWVKVTPKFGIQLIGGVDMRDITTASNIRSVKGRVTATSWYADFNFNDLELTGTLDEPVLTGIERLDSLLADYGLYTRLDFLDRSVRAPVIAFDATSFLSSIKQRRISLSNFWLFARIGIMPKFVPYVEFDENNSSESKRRQLRTPIVVSTPTPSTKR